MRSLDNAADFIFRDHHEDEPDMFTEPHAYHESVDTVVQKAKHRDINSMRIPALQVINDYQTQAIDVLNSEDAKSQHQTNLKLP